MWRNIRFLPSIFAEKNVTKNEHICSMCIKINKVGKQEVGIWRDQKGYHLSSFFSLYPGGGGRYTDLPLSVRRRYLLSHFFQQLSMAEIWYLITSFI
jgi:hypothetical protein